MAKKNTRRDGQHAVAAAVREYFVRLHELDELLIEFEWQIYESDLSARDRKKFQNALADLRCGKLPPWQFVERDKSQTERRVPKSSFASSKATAELEKGLARTYERAGRTDLARKARRRAATADRIAEKALKEGR